MTIYKVVADGGYPVTISEELAKDKDALLATLAATSPELANGDVIPNPEKDGVVIIEVKKKAGSHGANVFDPGKYLCKCEGGINPALEMWQRLEANPLDAAPEALLRLDAQIAQAIEQGGKHGERMEHAFHRLGAALPVPGPVVVTL